RLLRPGLQDAGAQDAQVQVLLVSCSDEGVERGVIEYAPPILQLAGLDAGIVRLDPLPGDRRRRLAVIGSDLEAVVDVLQRAGRDAAAVEQGRGGDDDP